MTSCDNNIQLDARPAQSENIVSRRILDELILVPTRKTAGEVDSLYTMNEVAAFVWEALDGTSSVREIRDKVVHEFQVDIETATDDLINLLKQLNDIGVVKGF
jgi:hypothetical protein